MASTKKQQTNGGYLVPREAIPPRRVYSQKWQPVWDKAAKLKRGGEGLAVDPALYSGTLNALHCALRRAKVRGWVPHDIRIHHREGTAYLHRS